MTTPDDSTGPYPTAASSVPGATASTISRTGKPPVILVALGGAGALLVILVAILLLGGDGGTKLATDYVTGLAARNAAAADLADIGLAEAAESIGLLGVPASVTFKVDGLETTTEKAGDSRIVTASWTLSATGQDGVVAQADQTLWAAVVKTEDGDRLANVIVGPPLAFHAEAYFAAGRSGDDAGRTADDLRAGNAWIPGTTVAIEPTEEGIPLPAVELPDPTHLDTWRSVESDGVIGVQTTWTVSLSSDGYPVESLVAAEAVTTPPVAARIKVGTMTLEDAAAAATGAARAFDGAITEGRDVGQLMTQGSPSISPAAVTAMAEQLPGVGDVDPSAIDTSGADVRVHVGDLELVMADGRWLVDGGSSHLVATFSPGSGSYSWSQGPSGALLDFSGCVEEAKVKVTFLGVTVWTDQPPEASFRIASTGDSRCDRSPGFETIVASWPGNKAGTPIYLDSTDPGQTVVRTAILPDGFDASAFPLTIRVTQVGDSAVDATFTASGQ